jgi:hypothetical protein
MTSTGRQPDQHADDPSIEELARLQGVGPIVSADDLARPGLFESDAEYEAFLADLHAWRRAGLV